MLEPVGGGRGHHDGVGGIGDNDVADPAVRQECEHVALHRIATQCLQGQWRHEPRRGMREQDHHVRTVRLKPSQELGRLVGGDGAGDAKGDQPTLEPTLQPALEPKLRAGHRAAATGSPITST